MLELQGYGDPMYVNIGYAWRGHYENNPCVPPMEENHVGTYRRRFAIPAEWAGKQVVVHIGSATSNVALYVNGQFAGYSEDSKLWAEFDITDAEIEMLDQTGRAQTPAAPQSSVNADPFGFDCGAPGVRPLPPFATL